MKDEPDTNLENMRFERDLDAAERAHNRLEDHNVQLENKLRDTKTLLAAAQVVITKQQERIEVLKERWRLANTCAGCGASLWMNTSVPHCDTCVLAEEQEEAWLNAIHKQNETEP